MGIDMTHRILLVGRGQKARERRHKLFADGREPEFVLCVVWLDEVVCDLVRKREVPNSRVNHRRTS